MKSNEIALVQFAIQSSKDLDQKELSEPMKEHLGSLIQIIKYLPGKDLKQPLKDIQNRFNKVNFEEYQNPQVLQFLKDEQQIREEDAQQDIQKFRMDNSDVEVLVFDNIQKFLNQ